MFLTNVIKKIKIFLYIKKIGARKKLCIFSELREKHFLKFYINTTWKKLGLIFCAICRES